MIAQQHNCASVFCTRPTMCNRKCDRFGQEGPARRCRSSDIHRGVRSPCAKSRAPARQIGCSVLLCAPAACSSRIRFEGSHSTPYASLRLHRSVTGEGIAQVLQHASTNSTTGSCGSWGTGALKRVLPCGAGQSDTAYTRTTPLPPETMPASMPCRHARTCACTSRAPQAGEHVVCRRAFAVRARGAAWACCAVCMHTACPTRWCTAACFCPR
jgi:hypothetical protein